MFIFTVFLRGRPEAQASVMLGRCVTMCSDSTSEAFSHRVAPRMFCDICDMFDLHETEDCPRQAMTSDSPPPSHHGGSRDAVRPYCDTCESRCILIVVCIVAFYRFVRESIIFLVVICSFYCASICEGGLGSRNSVRPSVCLSVCHTHAL